MLPKLLSAVNSGVDNTSIYALTMTPAKTAGLLALLTSLLAIIFNIHRILSLLQVKNYRNNTKSKHWPTILKSLSGGLSIGYVFMLLVPELAYINKKLYGGPISASVLALSGLLIFNSIQHYNLKKATSDHEAMGEWKFIGVRKAEKKSNFSISLGVFTVYSALVLMTLPLQFSHFKGDTMSMGLYVVTFILHLGFDALSVAEEDEERFKELSGRITAPVLLIATALASAGHLPESTLLSAFSLLAGIVIYKVFRVELRSASETSLAWLVTGAILFAALNTLTFQGSH